MPCVGSQGARAHLFRGGGPGRDTIGLVTPRSLINQPLAEVDPDIARIVAAETARQNDGIELIASENFTSRAVMEAVGPTLTNKYAEGYPGKRYYGGCVHVDEGEYPAIARAQALFPRAKPDAIPASVQPHAGSQANTAVYLACLKPGDTLLGMSLAHGGHLTHGHPLSISGKLYRVVSYGVSKETETIDWDAFQATAEAEKPKLIIAGASAYPRTLDFPRFRKIADFVTTTTHKTLRGPRAGLILCTPEWAKEVDRAVFPGIQGGPLEHVIAGKAVALKEAMEPDFARYQKQVVANAKVLAAAVASHGFRLVSGGTDTHLFLVDVGKRNLTGKVAEKALDAAGITVNKNRSE